MRFFLFSLILPLIIIMVTTKSMLAVAAETCSRVAIINYQEVLVDSNTSEKGEGLRFHLEKDPVALEYLRRYQENSSTKLPSAILGTVGTGLLLYGFFKTNSEDRNIFLISGTATILVNFLIARTIEINNESNLNRAIEEYNKRNLPKIFFSPEGTQGQIDLSNIKMKMGLVQQWSF